MLTSSFQHDYENGVTILQKLMETLEKSGHETFSDDYNEELNAFSLDISQPSKTVTQPKSDFLAALSQQYVSKSDELCSRIQNNGRSIAKNSVIKSNEQMSNK